MQKDIGRIKPGHGGDRSSGNRKHRFGVVFRIGGLRDAGADRIRHATLNQSRHAQHDAQNRRSAQNRSHPQLQPEHGKERKDGKKGRGPVD